jgi:lipopolysaccharide transport system ATP-binding protein
MIIDEVLGVGDAAFQRKCEARMRAMMADGRTIVIVSHDPGAVKTLCQRAIWLDRGVIRAIGQADEVVAEYASAY